MADLETQQQVQQATRYSAAQAAADLRQHVMASFAGSLATICRDEHALAGYPLSSVVPFVLDEAFRPVILIANIAEHTRNLTSNAKASIFLRQNDNCGNVQTQWRICMLGDLLQVPEAEIPAIADKYYCHYPESRNYHRTHNFYFFRLEIKKYRIIMGFGDISWLDAKGTYQACPMTLETRMGMINHMNQDHVIAMRKYLTDVGVTMSDTDDVVMCDIHHYGFVLRHQQELRFFPFNTPLETPAQVRSALVAMAK